MLAALVISTVQLWSGSLDPPEAKTRAAVARGLEWLASQQAKDGSWAGNGAFYKVARTSYAGLAMLMEGSTPQHGRYAENVRRTVGWVGSLAQPSGLLTANDVTPEPSRAMEQHTAALLFLASAYDVDDDGPRRARLKPVLENAVAYAVAGQTSRGGWGYVRGADAEQYDESGQTANALQSLLTARRAGIDVPQGAVDRAVRYLTNATTTNGGVAYSLITGAAHPGTETPLGTATTAASVALSFTSRRPAAFPGWVAYTRRTAPNLPRPGQPNRVSTNAGFLAHNLAFARLANALGEDGHRRLAPDAAETALLRWSHHRANLFDYLRACQSAEGAWLDTAYGSPYCTALALITLQLDNNYLPAFSR